MKDQGGYAKKMQLVLIGFEQDIEGRMKIPVFHSIKSGGVEYFRFDSAEVIRQEVYEECAVIAEKNTNQTGDYSVGDDIADIIRKQSIKAKKGVINLEDNTSKTK